jgi:3-oxoacyl-[acyl-carrier protein] reductase
MAPYGVTANTIMPSAHTRLAAIGWRSARNRETAPSEIDYGDPVHVAEMVCYVASPQAGYLSGQTFQVRGGTVEHVSAWEVDRVVDRDDRGWTAPDLAGEIPRMFGAGAKPAELPPKDWQSSYQAKGGSATGPSTPAQPT